MKKLLYLLFSIVLLMSVPAISFAQTNVTSMDINKLRNVAGFGDITILELMLNKSGNLPKIGEIDYEFDYETSYGNTIRYYLEDEDHVGMTLKIYDSGNNLIASGQTSSASQWKVLNTFTPANQDETYTIRIVSDDGDGGINYGYTVAVRAY